MTKIVFQVGFLAFFVSAVLFGTQGLPLFDIIARGFIVFIAVVTCQVVILMMATSMKRKAAQVPAERPPREEEEMPPEPPAGPGSQAPATAR